MLARPLGILALSLLLACHQPDAPAANHALLESDAQEPRIVEWWVPQLLLVDDDDPSAFRGPTPAEVLSETKRLSPLNQGQRRQYFQCNYPSENEKLKERDRFLHETAGSLESGSTERDVLALLGPPFTKEPRFSTDLWIYPHFAYRELNNNPTLRRDTCYSHLLIFRSGVLAYVVRDYYSPIE
jgi:hypothetical protein